MNKLAVLLTAFSLVAVRDATADTIHVYVPTAQTIYAGMDSQTFDIAAYFEPTVTGGTVALTGLNLSIQLGDAENAPSFVAAYFGGQTASGSEDPNFLFDANHTVDPLSPDPDFPAYAYSTFATDAGTVQLGATPKILARMTINTLGFSAGEFFDVRLDTSPGGYGLVTELLQGAGSPYGSVDLPVGQITLSAIPEPTTLAQLLSIATVGLIFVVRRWRGTRCG